MFWIALCAVAYVCMCLVFSVFLTGMVVNNMLKQKMVSIAFQCCFSDSFVCVKSSGLFLQTKDQTCGNKILAWLL